MLSSPISLQLYGFTLFALSAFSAVHCVSVASVGTSQYVNCFTDSSSHNLLEYFPSPNSGYTAQSCHDKAASLDFTLFGLEAGGQCFYDNRLNHLTLSNACSMACTSDTSERCGGVSAMDVWQLMETSSQMEPTLLSNTQYLGCFVDEEASRALPFTPTSLNSSDPNNNYNVQTCQAVSATYGYVYFGVEDGSQCFFGNSFTNNGGDISCSDPCSSDRSERCGGVWALDLYANQLIPSTLPGTTYVGCFLDSNSAPVLANNSHAINPNDPNTVYTVEMCQTVSKAGGYRYFGLENGGECFVGGSQLTFTPSNLCNMVCIANSAERCGGSSSIDLWKNQ